MPPIFQDGATVLFQGDSITDGGRSREEDGDLGRGYAGIAAWTFEALYPEKHVRFLNRGISGNRARDLRGRWEADCLALRPDWVSILVGINDTWRGFDSADPTTTESYEADYRDILTRTRDRAGARLILCEPFVLPYPDDRKAWRGDLDPRIHVVRELSREFGAILVPFDGLFAEAAARREPAFWASDGVHPTYPGHALMAQAWLRAVGAI
jgi:lysophospholipase L1-like esterase